MGVVYLGADAEQRQVAVKVLGPAVAGDPSARQRLAREVETMRRVRNRYVAEVLDADVQGPSPYIVTRYVPGLTLDDTVRRAARCAAWRSTPSPRGWPRRWPPSTRPGWCTATSSRATSCSTTGQPVVIDFGIAHVPGLHQADQDRPGDGHPGVPRAGGHRGQARPAARPTCTPGAPPWRTPPPAASRSARGNLPDDLLPRDRGQAELDGIPPHLLPYVTAALSTEPAVPAERAVAGRPARPAQERGAAAMPEVAATRADAAADPPDRPAAAGATPPAAPAGGPRRPGSRTARPRRPRRTWPTCCRRCVRRPRRPGGRRRPRRPGRRGRGPAQTGSRRARPAPPGGRGRRGRAQRAAPGSGHGGLPRGDHPAAGGRPGAGRAHRAAQPARRAAERHRDRDRHRPLDRRPRGAHHGLPRPAGLWSRPCWRRGRRSSSPGRGTLPGAGSWAAGAAVACYCVGPGSARAAAAAAPDVRVGHPQPGPR